MGRYRVGAAGPDCSDLFLEHILEILDGMPLEEQVPGRTRRLGLLVRLLAGDLYRGSYAYAALPCRRDLGLGHERDDEMMAFERGPNRMLPFYQGMMATFTTTAPQM
jgi:hypothetical protein